MCEHFKISDTTRQAEEIKISFWVTLNYVLVFCLNIFLPILCVLWYLFIYLFICLFIYLFIYLLYKFVHEAQNTVGPTCNNKIN